MRSPKSTPLGLYDIIQSPKYNSPALTSPLALGNLGNNNFDVQRLTDEVLSLRGKLASWEDSWSQSKQTYEAWRREATEQSEKAKAADRDRIQSLIKLGEVRKPLELNICFCLSSKKA